MWISYNSVRFGQIGFSQINNSSSPALQEKYDRADCSNITNNHKDAGVQVSTVRKKVARLIAKVTGDKEPDIRYYSEKHSSRIRGGRVSEYQKASGQKAEVSRSSNSTHSAALGTTQLEPDKSEKVVLPSDIQHAPMARSRFYPSKAKELIQQVLKQKLTGVVYNPELAPLLVKEITEDVKTGLKEMELDKYKIVVQAIIGEQHGQGFQMSCRCFWDPDTDDYAHDSFVNESIFCVAGAFALCLY